ncbi:hypothetical protein CONPUDRAFT_76917 [Coniophora puteana RWD-64-598 SS2]|uniref:DUF6534 domain-containing protein n=1 Tax=Coniophora puteana (strain RWD-64-598) TaxID=741705 RepID=A0A5M3MAI2_CONPW|nr:uncharacterized protein CONPUDRAFT_76917 [Coniophora puteana RWD-64-598 SS2]EIW75864.1 hypothetical protein CONPUDRAFT_76917 [Coniophora puteana RWD-64-598 SS2]
MAVATAFLQGPLLGTLTILLLYGVNCMQLFFYSQNYNDQMSLRLLVLGIWVLETVFVGLSINFIEFYVIEHFTDIQMLEKPVWSVPAAFLVGFTVAFIVNLAFIWRIWRICEKGKYWVTISLIVLAFTRLGRWTPIPVRNVRLTAFTALGWVNGILAFSSVTWLEFRESAFGTIISSWFLSAVVDILIAVSLSFYLYGRRTGMSRTDNIINRLLMYTINTGALTSIGAILVPVAFLALPKSTAFLGVLQVQTKLYSISFMASLNSRKSTIAHAERKVPTVEGTPLATLPQTPRLLKHFSMRKSGEGMSEPVLPRIEIQRTTVTDVYLERGDVDGNDIRDSDDDALSSQDRKHYVSRDAKRSTLSVPETPSSPRSPLRPASGERPRLAPIVVQHGHAR